MSDNNTRFFFGAFIGALIIYLLIRWHKLSVGGSLGCGCSDQAGASAGPVLVKSSCAAGSGTGVGVTFTAPLTVAQQLTPILPMPPVVVTRPFIRPQIYMRA